MRHLLGILLLALIFCFQASVSAQLRTIPDSLAVPLHPRKYFGRALGEILGINLGVWAFDRYVTRGDYAYINWQTLNDNFIHGFTWDNDQVATNFFGHPYHGSIYYNAARSNGYGYAAASAFTAAGSLNWEMFLENEYPSINDIFATTAGGMALGEAFFRISDRILDDRTTGGQRLTREFVSLLINPARGLTRLIHGDVWKTRQASGRQFDIPHFSANVSQGIKRLEINDEIPDTWFGFATDISAEYGEWDESNGMKPYDYFTVRGRFNIQKGQPFLGQVNLSARIWGTDWVDSKSDYLNFGVYQHFDYYDSGIISDLSNRVPYRFGAPASFGVGLMHENKRYGKWTFNSCFYLNALILGASLSDHYLVDNRDYNLGDGWSVQMDIVAGFDKKIELSLRHKGFHMFTLKGYPEGFDLQNAGKDELDFQGDKSNTSLNTWALRLNMRLTKNFCLTVERQTFSRFTHYRFFENVHSWSSENLILLGYMF